MPPRSVLTSDSGSSSDGSRPRIEDFHNPRRSYYLFLITCSYYLLVMVKDRRLAGSVMVKDRRFSRVSDGERPWKTP